MVCARLDPAKEAAHHRGVGFDPSLGRKAIAQRLKRDVRFLGPRGLQKGPVRHQLGSPMAAVSDRLSRAIPFNSLKPLDRHGFADLVPTRCCAAAHLAPRRHGQKKTLVAGEQDRPDISRHRKRWRTYQGLIDPRRLVFIDETWTKTNMTRLRGWAPRGQRLVDKVPQGKWKTATFLAALRNDRIDAPCLFDGPINGERFHAYVEQFLVPTLKPGDVVILDNLGSHKGKAVRTAIRDVGARLVFLPKYSPDLNPIEQVFAKFKTLLRKAGARSYQAISDACGEILAQYPPAECAAYLKNAGYA